MNDEKLTLDTRSDYEQIGIEHNEGLDYIFKRLETNNPKQRPSIKRANIQDIYVQAKILGKEYLATKSNLAKKNKESAFSTFQSYFPDKSRSRRNMDREVVFSEVQTEYLQRLNSIIDDTTLNLPQILEEIKKLEVIISEECNEQDKHILLSSTAVARHSLAYWHKNLTSWMGKLGTTIASPNDFPKARSYSENNVPDEYPFLPAEYGFNELPDGFYAWPYNNTFVVEVCQGDAILIKGPDGLVWNPVVKGWDWPEEAGSSLWKDVGKADIAGAAAGATAVGVGAVITGPPGWVGGIATVVSGALGASTYEAIYQSF